MAVGSLAAVAAVVLTGLVVTGDGDDEPAVSVAGDAVENADDPGVDDDSSDPNGSGSAASSDAVSTSEVTAPSDGSTSTAPARPTTTVAAATSSPSTVAAVPTPRPTTSTTAAPPPTPRLEVRHEASATAATRWFEVVHEVTNTGDGPWSTTTSSTCFGDPVAIDVDGAVAPRPNTQVCGDAVTTWTIEPGETRRFTSSIDTVLLAPGAYTIDGPTFGFDGSFVVPPGRTGLVTDLAEATDVSVDWTSGALGVVRHDVEARRAVFFDVLPCRSWGRLLDASGGVVATSADDCGASRLVLDAGQSEAFATVIDLDGVAPGRYRLQVWGLAGLDADVEVAAPESGTAVLAETVTVSETVRAGEAVVVEHVLRNDGDATWRADRRSACSSELVLTAGDGGAVLREGPFAFGSWCDEVQIALAPGEERTTVHEVRIPSTVEAGTYDLEITGFIDHAGSLVVEPAEDETVEISSDEGESR